MVGCLTPDLLQIVERLLPNSESPPQEVRRLSEPWHPNPSEQEIRRARPPRRYRGAGDYRPSDVEGRRRRRSANHRIMSSCDEVSRDIDIEPPIGRRSGYIALIVILHN